jgi:hypothetical protein
MLSSEVAQAMISNLAFGSLIDMERAGHAIPSDNPQVFEIVIRNFLKKL